MHSWPTPYAVLMASWLGVFLSLVGLFLLNQRLRRLLSADRFCVVVVVSTSIVVSLIANAHPFFGQEYEDAYEYTYSGLLLNYQPETRSSGLNSVCVEGSLLRCRRFMTLSHPIGLSVLVSACAATFGLSCEYVRYINCGAFFITALMVYLLARMWGKSPLCGLSATLLYLFTPEVFAFSQTGLSEPASASLVLLTFFFSSTLVLVDVRGQSRLGNLNSALGLFLALSVAVFVRRENLILCIAMPPLFFLARLLFGGKNEVTNLRLLTAICLASFLLSIAAPYQLLDFEAVRPANGPSFSFNNLALLGPRFFGHLFNPALYFLLPWSVVASVVWWRKATGLEFVAAGLLLTYFLVISAFSQSYSFAVLGKDPSFHFARYSTEIAPLLALLGAGGIEALLLNWLLPRGGIPTVAVCVGAALILALSLGRSIRSRLAADEEVTHILPTAWICNSVPDGGTIISPQPVLLGLVCDPDREILDYAQIGYGISQESLERSVAAGQAYVFWSSVESAANAQRYPRAARSLADYRQRVVADLRVGDNRYQLSRLEANPIAGPNAVP